MTKLTFAALALVAAAACSTQASAAGNNAAVRRANASMTTTTVSSKTTDCVRAPKVGSFATAPFTEPPCMPGTMR
ncbi:ABC-type Fe3+-hydroxamate transport system substrate-binding protein [Bradyrhizobium japonicum]|uniref:hypothetical protein n=1 Tax=Bradyrhizobium elkanii TaxID=29448 RepID=UPI0009B730CD|nr:hypothetical protein [Bradyrhizobium elkanii]MCP1732568.1 ABC-type Fe3+-hydroxamate transport system substrate-binding protein [Bradyrhizobium elkanii]MCS3567906.1 putative lipoprotein YajG [Bradyrhizobium elkanii]MCS3590611.1 ABC-type Fe3+-hydroxamate transport system substrate-binding protein [Bradyrhizobium elkanii]MCS3620054.1 ABC-type Fe3+-hydroxamate transport system substrate-binding protein [Bradyrhizobium elkanii]MCW2111692.1 ABC-type Fe3+-hydroxamate transport system substrate-bin